MGFLIPVGAVAQLWRRVPPLGLLLGSVLATAAQTEPPLQFPTANTTLLEPAGNERFFVGTVGKPWTSGTFGCVRTEGWQLHEGLDIRCLLRTRTGEPADPVRATADGHVAYANPKAGLSSYGIYIVLRHQLSGIELYSLYAHLSQIQPDLKPGQPVRAGQVIGTMGRTTNTRQTISKDRAHLHFELNLLLNDRFHQWHTQTIGSRNDHGAFNGQNFAGLDPRLLLLSSHRFPTNFNLRRFLTNQTELCRVAVRATNFPFLQRYPQLILNAHLTNSAPIAGYEIHLDYAGVPCRLLARTDAELPQSGHFNLLQVNEEEQRLRPCRRLVTRSGDHWSLARNGSRLLELLTF